MTTRLEAINTMLSCIDHMPLNTLQGTQSAFTVAAQSILDSENQRVQLKGWDFNTEENYPLTPDIDGIIKIAENMIKVEIHQAYLNRYVVREGQIYDKVDHTFVIRHPLEASITFEIPFEDLPEVVKRYVTMSAAYKFTKRQLGSQASCIYTQEDLNEAKADMLVHELALGNYSMIPAYYTNHIRSEL